VAVIRGYKTDKEGNMPGKKKTPEQVIGIIRDAEILLAEGHSGATASRKLGMSEQSYYRWRTRNMAA
jgi:hypothetical protein